MFKVFSIIGLAIFLISCSKGGKDSTGNLDSLALPSQPKDTLGAYMDLHDIKVKGDSMFIFFSAGDSGANAWVRMKNRGPQAGAAAGTPESFDFTFKGAPNEMLLGVRFYVRYFETPPFNKVVFLEQQGDLLKFMGSWRLVELDDEGYYFPIYADSTPPVITISLDSDEPLFSVSIGTDTKYYVIKEFNTRAFGSEGTFEISSSSEGALTVRTKDLAEEGGIYRSAIFTGIFPESTIFAHPDHVNSYPERQKK